MDSLFPMAVQSDDLLNNCVDLRRLGPGGGGGCGGGDATTDEDMVWFSSDLLSYQPLLNDCMLSQASNVPLMINSKDVLLSSCGQILNDQEFEQDLLTLVNPNMAMTLDKEGEASVKVEELSTPEAIETDLSTALSSAEIEECLIDDRVHVSPIATVISSGIGTHSTYVLTYRPSKNSILKPQTIALTSRAQTPLEVSERLGHKLLPKVQIRVMPRSVAATRMTGVTVGNQENAKNLPLSPPNSDSDGSVSPVRSERLGITQNFSPPRPKIMNHATLLSNSMPSSGSLFLSEEEERTLISEGYPVPTKWPLTKQEEKILKKIQRKIKNKVSAQESRRKKKDYIDSLEKRLEASNMENSSLKKKVDKLEHGNRVLMSQIEQLKKAIQSVSAQTSTYIMVFVLFFAMFLGVLSPLTSTQLSPGPAVGLHEGQQPRNPITADLLPTGPQVAVEGSDYKTSMKSRTLLSVLEDSDESFEVQSPSTCYSGLLGWLSVLQLGHHKHKHCEQLPDIPTAIPLIVDIQDQNRVETSSENLTEWSNKGEKKPSIDRIYVSDIITVPASES